MLEQIAVVAGEFDHLIPWAEVEPLHHPFRVHAAVFDPAIRIRREVRIFAEDMLVADVGLELDQETLAADVDVERVEGLHLVQLVTTHVTFAKRRHSQIHEGLV